MNPTTNIDRRRIAGGTSPTAINGDHVLGATVNGRPSYQLASGTDIRWSGTYWEIRSGSTARWRSASPHGTLPSDVAAWTAQNSSTGTITVTALSRGADSLVGSSSPGAPTAAEELIAAGGGGAPTAAGEIYAPATGGAASLIFGYEMPGDFPVGTYVRLGTSSSLGEVWALSGSVNDLSIDESGDLVGPGEVWVQRNGGTFVWSLEASSNWASVSPTVYLQQTSGGATRGEFPTPASVATGGWLDIINDIDPDEEGLVLDLEGGGPPAAASLVGADSAPTPTAPGSIV